MIIDSSFPFVESVVRPTSIDLYAHKVQSNNNLSACLTSFSACIRRLFTSLQDLHDANVLPYDAMTAV